MNSSDLLMFHPKTNYPGGEVKDIDQSDYSLSIISPNGSVLYLKKVSNVQTSMDFPSFIFLLLESIP